MELIWDYYIIIMNDTMSLVLATAILAAGGLGLFMYKSSDDNQKGGDYDENKLFGSNSFWGSNNEEEELNDEDDDYYEPKVTNRGQRGGKTKRSRKTGGTKRRY